MMLMARSKYFWTFTLAMIGRRDGHVGFRLSGAKPKRGLYGAAMGLAAAGSEAFSDPT